MSLEDKARDMVHDAMIHDDDYEAQAIHHAKNVITNAWAGLGTSIALMIFWLVRPEAIGAHLTLMAATIWMLWSTHIEARQMKRYAQMYRDVLDRKNVERWDESGKVRGGRRRQTGRGSARPPDARLIGGISSDIGRQSERRFISSIGVDDGYLYWDYNVVIEREKKEPAGRDKK